MMGGMDPDYAAAPPRSDQGPPPAGRRTLYREPEDKKIAGVCGGLADYTGLDPTLVRAGAVLLALLEPAFVVAYLVAIFVVHERPPSVPRTTAPPVEVLERHPWLPLAVIVIAVLVGLDGRWWWRPDVPLAAPLLIGIGVWLFVRSRDGGPPPDTPAGSGAAPGPFDPSTDQPRNVVETPPQKPTSPPYAEDSLSLGVDSTTRNEDAGSTVDRTADVRDAARPPGGISPPTPPGWSGPGGVAGGRWASRGSGRLGVLVASGLLVGGGAAWLVDTTDVADVDPRDVLAVGLVVVGLALVVAAWRGRALAALVPVGLLAVAGLAAGEVVDVPLDAGMGDRTVVVDRPSELDEPIQLFAGELVVDLRDLPLSRTHPTTVRAGVGLGVLRVLVPRSANLLVDLDVRVGELAGVLQEASDTDEGALIDQLVRVPGTEGAPRIDLVLDMGAGEVEVARG